jgi:hypothetical protein
MKKRLPRQAFICRANLGISDLTGYAGVPLIQFQSFLGLCFCGLWRASIHDGSTIAGKTASPVVARSPCNPPEEPSSFSASIPRLRDAIATGGQGPRSP